MNYILQQQNNVYITIQIQPMQIGHKQEWVLKKTQSFLKSMAVSHFLNSTSNDITDACPDPNPNPTQ